MPTPTGHATAYNFDKLNISAQLLRIPYSTDRVFFFFNLNFIDQGVLGSWCEAYFRIQEVAMNPSIATLYRGLRKIMSPQEANRPMINVARPIDNKFEASVLDMLSISVT
jgi:hypothetical protein